MNQNQKQLRPHSSECARIVLSFDRDWLFWKGDAGGAAEPGFDDSSWRKLDVPHDFSIEEPFDPHMENGGTQGYLPRQTIAWYRKTFRMTPDLHGKQISLLFDGIHNHSEVWVNGTRLGHRPYGYVSFQYDLTPYLQAEGDNTVAVRLDNTGPLMDRWYSGSGIYRHVWLVATEALRIKTWGTFITTPQVSEETASVHAQTEMVNGLAKAVSCVVRTEIRDGDGGVVAQTETALVLQPGETGTTLQTLAVLKPKLWSPDHPRLYEAYTSLRVNGVSADDYSTVFGIRDIVLDNEKGMLLNGKSLKLKGVCIHHDLGCLGAAFHEQAMERRLQALKSTGCNAIRFSHNPMAPELLDLCDRLGFLVVNEAFDKWKSLSYEPLFDEWWRRDLEDFIRRDRNHPSVFLWSIGNEVENQGQPEMLELLGMLVDCCHELDPSRPATCALEPHNFPRSLFYGPVEEKVEVTKRLAEKVDILSLNYQEQWYGHYRQAIPDKLIMGSESFPYYRGKENLLKAFEPMNPWFDVANHDYVVGQFIWPGIDYLGEASYPYKGWQTGFIDTCGFRKPMSYFHESLWSDRPMVHIAVYDDTVNLSIPSRWSAHWFSPKVISSWTLPHFENQLVRLATYTNCDSVELILNGESLGEKRLRDFPDHIMVWHVPYAAGTLEAVGRNGGEICAAHTLRTAGEASRVILKPEQREIRANGTDLAHVEVNIADEQGQLMPAAEVKVRFELEGPGRIVGVDSGNLASDEPFVGTGRTTYLGKGLVVIRSTGGSGTITLRAFAEGLKSDETAIEVTGELNG